MSGLQNNRPFLDEAGLSRKLCRRGGLLTFLPLPMRMSLSGALDAPMRARHGPYCEVLVSQAKLSLKGCCVTPHAVLGITLDPVEQTCPTLLPGPTERFLVLTDAMLLSSC